MLLLGSLDSMKPEVCDRFIAYDFVEDIWDTIIKLYSKLEGKLRMQKGNNYLNKRAMELLQEQHNVLEYSNESTTLWSEIDRLHNQGIHLEGKKL